MILRTLASAALVFGAIAASAQPAPTPAPAAAPAVDSVKFDAVRHLIGVMGVRKSLEAYMSRMIDVYRKTMPSVPGAFWDEFQKGSNPDGIIDLVVPIYARHLTLEDIRAMDAFYSSPAGQRFVAAQPEILQESMTAGQVWGAAIAAKLQEQLKAKGYVKSS